MRQFRFKKTLTCIFVHRSKSHLVTKIFPCAKILRPSFRNESHISFRNDSLRRLSDPVTYNMGQKNRGFKKTLTLKFSYIKNIGAGYSVYQNFCAHFETTVIYHIERTGQLFCRTHFKMKVIPSYRTERHAGTFFSRLSVVYHFERRVTLPMMNNRQPEHAPAGACILTGAYRKEDHENFEKTVRRAYYAHCQKL